MAEGSEGAAGLPKKVEYDPITGVPSEFNEYLLKDCEEYRKCVKTAFLLLVHLLLLSRWPRLYDFSSHASLYSCKIQW